MEKYSWNFYENDDIWRNSADSVKECVYQAKEEADGESVVYIGKNIPFVPMVSAESVLEELEEQASDFCDEVGEACDYRTMQKELVELSEKLTVVVVEWLKKHGRKPNFYRVEDIRTYPLSQPAEED